MCRLVQIMNYCNMYANYCKGQYNRLLVKTPILRYILGYCNPNFILR